MVRSLIWLLRLLLPMCLGLAAPAYAHLTPNSEIGLSIGRSAVAADIVIPLGEVHYAEPSLARATPSELGRWLLQHVDVRAPDGARWTIAIEGVGITPGVVPDLQAHMSLVPPPAAPLRRFTLRYDAVVDKVPGHFVLVWLKDDYDGGRLGSRPELLAGLRRGAVETFVDRGVQSGWRGFWAAIGLGMKHIAEGHDHLLFLVGLLLPAPLLARTSSWGGYAGGRHMMRMLVTIVTAFTLGHSLTLIGGALFSWQLPPRPVEALIALSILVTAIHAWRPIFAGREALIAAGFGLVHGLAFATIIGHFALDPWPRAQAILGFNVGIELVQLVVVATIAPPLAMLAKTGGYEGVRRAGAAVIAIAAILWLGERLSGMEWRLARLIDDALGYAPYILVPMLMLSAFWAWRTSTGHAPQDRR